MRVPLLISIPVAISLVLAFLGVVFELASVGRRARLVADLELDVLLAEATAQLDLAESTATTPIHRAWFRAFADEARLGQPLRSARALAEWTRAVNSGYAMTLGTPAQKHALEALAIAGEIAAHRRAPRGMR